MDILHKYYLKNQQDIDNMSEEFLFTSESVSEGHPDKVSDIVSDSIVDDFMSQSNPENVKSCR